MKNKLTEFLLEYCKQKRLSLRSLSINAGLSPGAVHNIIHRRYKPSLSSLNRIADYLGVQREYLWQLAGFINNQDDSSRDAFADQRLVSFSMRFNKLSQSDRDTVINVVGSLIAFLEENGTETRQAINK